MWAGRMSKYWQVVNIGIQNTLIADAMKAICESVQKGESVADAVRITGIFPPVVFHLLSTGQMSGNIEDGLADFPDGMFDVVILSQTVAYLNRPLGVMQEMARVGRSAIISFENAGYWQVRWRAVFGDGSGNTLASGQPRIRSITLVQFREALTQLALRSEAGVFLRGGSRVGWWPSLWADAAVFRVAKA